MKFANHSLNSKFSVEFNFDLYLSTVTAHFTSDHKDRSVNDLFQPHNCIHLVVTYFTWEKVQISLWHVTSFWNI